MNLDVNLAVSTQKKTTNEHEFTRMGWPVSRRYPLGGRHQMVISASLFKAHLRVVPVIVRVYSCPFVVAFNC
jgi:hypothetical protein